ncbi:hypothetical protein ACLOJK_020435 [Asimina triloba]
MRIKIVEPTQMGILSQERDAQDLRRGALGRRVVQCESLRWNGGNTGLELWGEEGMGADSRSASEIEDSHVRSECRATSTTKILICTKKRRTKQESSLSLKGFERTRCQDPMQLRKMSHRAMASSLFEKKGWSQ